MNRPSSCLPALHVGRRAFLKGVAVGAAGLAVPNFGSLFHSQSIAAEARRQGKRCLLLWMNGGASQIDTFDMKPGQPNAGPFRPIQTNVAGTQVCEYLPRIARHMDKLAVIRSMQTSEPDHPGGIYLMHTGQRPTVNVAHPELGAMCAKYLGSDDSDVPNFIRMGSTGNGGAGFLGPQFQPFSVQRDGRISDFSGSNVTPEASDRRNDLLRFMESGFSRDHKAEPFEAHRMARERVWRLMRVRQVFDTTAEWGRHKERYGDTEFGRRCCLALKLLEQGVSFVEVGQENYDSHADNFIVHKACLQVLDAAWASLLEDMQSRGLLQDTLVVWMGEVGRTPQINNRVGRDHFVRGWTTVLGGGMIKGGVTYGATNPDGNGVRENPVTEGDFFATVYTALGINPRVRHMVGSRPIWATPENAKIVREVLA
ncbi:MAG: DUF1501 domain-containing protein [Gemmataceae bacterium]|nr:DUF1501 domain-containing protein [Gemmataceae bacterium]